MILATFDLQVILILPMKFESIALLVKGFFGSGIEVKNKFSRWPSWISDWNHILLFFYLHGTPMLPTKFRVNWPFRSGAEVKINFNMATMAVTLDFRLERFIYF